MALPISQLPFSLSSTTSPKSTHPNAALRTVAKPTTFFLSSKQPPKLPQFASKPRKFTNIPKASTEEGEENAANNENTSNPPAESRDEMTELGAEIKRAMMKEREERETGLLSGVVEEIGEIEWPAFNKVLGTTGVVLGVIAGSSVVLLTVNAVLAEISDRVFAGKGVQDFFG